MQLYGGKKKYIYKYIYNYILQLCGMDLYYFKQVVINIQYLFSKYLNSNKKKFKKVNTAY